MKKQVKSLIAVALIAAFLVPATGLKNSNRHKNGSHNGATILCIDPIGERG